MLLSVVIPTMNKVELLRQTLAALRAQELRRSGEWEIVVVNDGSTDGTADYLAAEADWTAPALRVVQPERNVGRAAARNLGARAAQGEYLLFIDDDIVTPPGLVAAHLDLLLDNPGCGTIGYAVTEPGLIDAPHFWYLDSRGVARLPDGLAPGRFFVTQNAAVPRSAFLAVDGFDERYTGYGFEDMEVAFRLEDEAEVRFLALTAPVPRHVHHHTLDQYAAKKVECGQQSLPRLAIDHPHRLREMHLHHVVNGDREAARAALTRIGRFLAGVSRANVLWPLLAGWPTRSRSQPILGNIYYRFMNLAVLASYCQGLADYEEGHVNSA